MVFAIAAILAVTASAAADARSDYLIRLLKDSSQFRVRAQAAISLGSIRGDPAVVKALSEALGDQHPAVRAASASSLERAGDPAALPALQAARDDEEEAVRSAVRRAIATLQQKPEASPEAVSTSATAKSQALTGPLKYYIGIGMPGTRAQSVDRDTLQHTRQVIENQVRGFGGVLIAPESETTKTALTVIKDRNLKGYYLDSSIVSLEELPEGGTRAVVSIIVGTYPERNMRMILQGAARVIGNAGSAKTQAIEGAIQGALRQLPQAFASGSQ